MIPDTAKFHTVENECVSSILNAKSDDPRSRMSVVRRGLERVQRQLITDCKARLSHQAEMLGDHLLPDSSVLDVGCGTGHFPKYLEEMYGVKSTGLDVADINETDIAFAVFDGTRIPLPDQSFDHVVLSFTLHHAHEPMSLIQECRRVARRSVLVFEDMPDNRYGRWFLKFHVELFRLYYKLRPVHDADYRRALEWLGNDAVNVVEVQMPSQWFTREGGWFYRVPRFLLVYELGVLTTDVGDGVVR
jgi:SAM-dependent methyltransferase